MHSCIYAGRVRHRRYSPVANIFSYRIFQLYLDLAELPHVLEHSVIASARHAACIRFSPADHFDGETRDLASKVREHVERLTGDVPNGRICLLTSPRILGYVMNPVSFYYCFDGAADSLHSVLAEVTNTPWGERHYYAIPVKRDRNCRAADVCIDKDFHVSPFMSMDMSYRFRLTEPGSQLAVSIQNRPKLSAGYRDNPDDASRPDTGMTRPFDVTMQLRRSELNAANLMRFFVTYPLSTLKVATAIYWQAFRLWRKKVPFYTHSAKDVRNRLTTVVSSEATVPSL